MTSPSNDSRQEGKVHSSVEPRQDSITSPQLPPADPIERANQQMHQTRKMIAYYQSQADHCGLFDKFYGLQGLYLQQMEAEKKLLVTQEEALKKYHADKLKNGDAAKYKIDTRSYIKENQQINDDAEKLYDQACGKIITVGTIAVATVATPVLAAPLAAAGVFGGGVAATGLAATTAGTVAGTGFALASNSLKEASKDNGSAVNAFKDSRQQLITSLETAASTVLPLLYFAKYGKPLFTMAKAEASLGYGQKALHAAQNILTNMGVASAPAALTSTALSATSAIRGEREFFSWDTAKQIAVNTVASVFGAFVGVKGSMLRSGVNNVRAKLGLLALESGVIVGGDVASVRLIKGGDLDIADWLNIGTGNISGYVTGRVTRDRVENYKTLTSNVCHPVDVVDPRTGLATKAVLASKEWCAEINNAIPGDKVVVNMDFKNMAAMNKNGLGGTANSILEYIKVASDKTLPKGSVVLRTGGDEIALILPHDAQNPEAAGKAIASFTDAMAAERTRLMGQVNQDAAHRARQFVAARDTLRSLLKGAPGGKHLSLSDFQTRIDETLSKFGYSSDRDSGISVDQKLDIIVRHAYQNLTAAPETMLGLSAGAAKINSASPEILYRALAQGDKAVHEAKGTNSEQVEIANLEDSILLRASEQNEISGNQKLSQEFGLARNLTKNFFGDMQPEVTQLTRISGTDPSSLQNLRQNLSVGFKCGDVFGPKMKNEMQAVVFDINGFGAINNNMGTSRGDEVYSAMTAIARQHFGDDVVMIRRNGGEIVVFNNGDPISNTQIEKISTEMDQVISSKMDTPAKESCIAEFKVRQALSRMLGGDSYADSSFGTIIPSTSIVQVRPQETIGDLFSRLGETVVSRRDHGANPPQIEMSK